MTHDRGVEVALRPARWPYLAGLGAVALLVALLVLGGSDGPGAVRPGDADADADAVSPAPPPTDLPATVETAGDLLWAATVEGAGGRAPVVVGEVVVVATDDGSLVGLERDTGSLRWRSPAAGPSPTEPVALGPFVVTASGTSLTAVRAVDGTAGWSYTLPGPATLRPAVAGNRLVVLTSDGALGFDGHRGELRWEQTLLGDPPSLAPVADTRLAMIAIGPDAVAIDAASSSIVWSRAFDDELAAVGVAHGVGYASTSLGRVVSTVGWDVRVPGPVVAEPVAVGNVAVFASSGGLVHAIDVNSGRTLWERRAASAITSPLAARRDVVFVTTDDGLLHRLDPSDGRRIGTARTGPGARVDVNDGPGPALFTVDDADVVAGLR